MKQHAVALAALWALCGIGHTGWAQGGSGKIRLNQLGFYPNGPKAAVVTGDAGSDRFYVLSTNLRDTVFTGNLSGPRQSAYSNTTCRMADFSSLKQKGSYLLAVPGTGYSPLFLIREKVHGELGTATLKGFYFQRSNMALDPQYAGKWHRSTGHADTKVLVHPSAAGPGRSAGTVIASPGGWYDAGDYNKYIVNSGITMGTLLSAYEDFPAEFRQLKVGIPESGNAIPDILDEAIYNLRWMLTMQDPADGGVYHKCTHADFDGMVLPGVTKADRYVVKKSTAAALNFAAVTAQAARVLKPFEPQLKGLSDSCLKASLRAWAWSQANPGMYYEQEEMNKQASPKITTGAYGDRQLDDERLWAASELFVTTANASYLAVARSMMKKRFTVPSWNSVGTMGYLTLLRHKDRLKDAALQAAITDSLLQHANAFLSNASKNAFGTVMGQSPADFVWGSNAVASNQGLILVKAYQLTGEERYLQGAVSNLDYLLGRNATGFCFVTGFGSVSPMHPHHRPSEGDGVKDPVPGLLVGGPNPGMQDKCEYPLKETETAYTDQVCSYASNEIAINWNAPIAYLANAIEFLYARKSNALPAGSSAKR